MKDVSLYLYWNSVIEEQKENFTSPTLYNLMHRSYDMPYTDSLYELKQCLNSYALSQLVYHFADCLHRSIMLQSVGLSEEDLTLQGILMQTLSLVSTSHFVHILPVYPFENTI